MFSYIWPIALAILSNVLYHICAKTTPEGIHPFASLTVTYLTGAVLSAVLYYVLAPQANLVKECSRLNWAPFALGIVIVGLEGGWLYAYKAGWQDCSECFRLGTAPVCGLFPLPRGAFMEQIARYRNLSPWPCLYQSELSIQSPTGAVF